MDETKERFTFSPIPFPTLSLRTFADNNFQNSSAALKDGKKLSDVVFKPNVQVMRLTKMEPVSEFRLQKSPSLPSSPTPNHRAETSKYFPAYVTLGRKSDQQNVSRNTCFQTTRSNSDSCTDREEIQRIRCILASLDLAKYKRRGSDRDVTMSAPLMRTVSAEPSITQNEIPMTKSLLDSLPPPPSATLRRELHFSNGCENKKYGTMSDNIQRVDNNRNYQAFVPDSTRTGLTSPVSKSASAKLKQLTDRLTSSSAPPSPHNKVKVTLPHTAPPTSAVTFWKEPLPAIEQTSFTFDDYEDIKKSQVKENKEITLQNLPSVTKYSTLPRIKPFSSDKKLHNMQENDNNGIFGSRNEGIMSLPSSPLSKARERTENLNELKNALPETLKKFGILSLSTSLNSSRKNEIGESFTFDLSAVKDYMAQLSYQATNLEDNSFSQDSTKLNYKEVTSEISYDSDSSNFKEPRNHRFNKDQYYDSNSSITSKSLCSIPKEQLNNIYVSKPFTKLQNSNGEYNGKYDSLGGSEYEMPLEIIKDDFAASPLVSMKPKDLVNARIDEKIHVVYAKKNTSEPSLEYHKTHGEHEDLDAVRPRAMSATVPTDPKSSPQQLKYSKKRLRGPYGEMLEQEMSKSATKQRPSYANELDFLKELDSIKPVKSPPRPFLRSTSHSFDGGTSTSACVTTRKTSANIPLINHDTDRHPFVPVVSKTVSESKSLPSSVSDLKSAKSPSCWIKTDDFTHALVKMSNQDTRTHVVGELYETETSYVESLQILVKKYMKPLKSSDHAGAIDSCHVDEIFYQIPEILSQHEAFLEVLKQRLTNWDTKQKIGDVFIDVFTRQSVIDTYTAFINNWKSAKDAIKSASLAKPAFAKFLEQTSREHKGKLTLDALLIMPVQRIPRYELLIKELLKHTPVDHPDHRLLLQAQKEIHDLAVNINRVEREALEQEQMLQKLKELEHLIEGIVDLVQCDRLYIRHDFVCIPGGLGIKKDRCLFLFSDLLLITNIKKKTTAMRKTSISVNTTFGALESNKYKLLMRLPLQNIEIIKKVDEHSVKRFLKEVGYLETDVAVLGKISDMLGTLSCQHQILDDAVKEILSLVSKQLIDKQAMNSQLMALDLAVTMQNEVENLTVIFPNPEKRMSWEASFAEAKENLGMLTRRMQPPTFLHSIPIQKTRAGLQVTCAVSCEHSFPDVWICNSDGYVGQVCILSLCEEPTLSTCSNVCNAKILCIIHVPGHSASRHELRRRSTVLSQFTTFKLEKCETDASKHFKSFQLDSDTSDEEDFIDSGDEDDINAYSSLKHDEDTTESTVWLGTEDGCIYVYAAEDIRLKKTKWKFQHSAAVYDFIYIDEKIYVSLANGDIFVYSRDQVTGYWNRSPQKFEVTSPNAPLSKVIFAAGKLWCGSANNIILLNIETLEIEHTFEVVPDPDRTVASIVSSSVGVWVAVQNSPVIRLFHFFSFHEILEINIAPAVTKMLSACDDIIRQHKSACLRVSALHVCKNLLWIGTSAGVLLTLPIPSSASLTSAAELLSTISGVSHGHTGHVRMITSSSVASELITSSSKVSDQSVRRKETDLPDQKPTSVVVICAGDGYEDFACVAFSESAGHDDSTNHLLLWKV